MLGRPGLVRGRHQHERQARTPSRPRRQRLRQAVLLAPERSVRSTGRPSSTIRSAREPIDAVCARSLGKSVSRMIRMPGAGQRIALKVVGERVVAVLASWSFELPAEERAGSDTDQTGRGCSQRSTSLAIRLAQPARDRARAAPSRWSGRRSGRPAGPRSSSRPGSPRRRPAARAE